jgi:predicted ATP-dependent endonuclease of OLD family
LLLDEPGLFLHPSAQEGLLELFDEIAADNVIVYSTHLPFMIPKNHPERLRLLIEDPEGEVRVESKVRARDPRLRSWRVSSPIRRRTTPP